MINIALITEDSLSEIVARKILMISDNSYRVHSYERWPKHKIKDKIKGINYAAKHTTQDYMFFVLTDQDTSKRCPPKARRELRAQVYPNLLYRFAVMEIESWVMAHRQAISTFLSVPLNKIPLYPDTITQPKEHLVKLVRKYSSKTIKRDIVPHPSSTSKIGPGYNGRLGSFVLNKWDVKIALQHSPSLKRTFTRLQEFTHSPAGQHHEQ